MSLFVICVLTKRFMADLCHSRGSCKIKDQGIDFAYSDKICVFTFFFLSLCGFHAKPTVAGLDVVLGKTMLR
jgi:hypothetical protein